VSVWDNTRFVAIDTETTGLHDDARVLSVACFCLENGVTVKSWSTVINAGIYGAAHIHGLDPSKLAGAKPFAHYADVLRDLLTMPGGTVYVLAHNIVYDAARLTYEYDLLGQTLPDVVLLDTRDLARAAGFIVPGSTLDDLATAFKLPNIARHEANADAIVVREAALRCLNALDDKGIDLTDVIVSAPPPSPPTRPATGKLTAEHAALHDMALLTKKDRDTSLGGCLDLSCPDLHKRIEDGITSTTTARAAFDWTLTALRRPDLSRFQRGLLVAGAARTLSGWRNTAARPDHKLLFTKALDVLATEPNWTACAPADECDYCSQGRPERCRFVISPRRLVWPSLYGESGNLITASAEAYLTGAAKTPLTTRSGWDKLRQHAPDAANVVLARVAVALRQTGRTEVARPAIEKLWKNGARDPQLALVYAAIAEDEKVNGDKLTAFTHAATICQDALASPSVTTSYDWQQVKTRLARLQGRINAATKTPPKAPYNTRSPHRSRFVKP